MTPRERILAAIEFTGPDRCPRAHAIFPGVFWKYGQKLLDLMEQYPDDFGNQTVQVHGSLPPDEGDETSTIVQERDEWGSVSRRLHGYTAGQVLEPAIPSWEAYKHYEFPRLPADSVFEEFAARVEREHPHNFVSAGGGQMFHLLVSLRGTENLFMDLAEDNEGLNDLADRLVKRNLYASEKYIKLGADCLSFADDWGMQDRLLIHPDTWRRFFKPRYKRMMEAARDAGVHVWFHSDGYTMDIFEDLLEIGVTVLNPQHTIMGTRKVGEMLGGRVCVCTDIDRQHVIPFGTPAQVTEAVKEAIAAFGTCSGGCLLNGEVSPNTPFENIVALCSAYNEYGQYPLDWLVKA